MDSEANVRGVSDQRRPQTGLGDCFRTCRRRGLPALGSDNELVLYEITTVESRTVDGEHCVPTASYRHESTVALVMVIAGTDSSRNAHGLPVDSYTCTVRALEPAIVERIAMVVPTSPPRSRRPLVVLARGAKAGLATCCEGAWLSQTNAIVFARQLIHLPRGDCDVLA